MNFDFHKMSAGFLIHKIIHSSVLKNGSTEHIIFLPFIKEFSKARRSQNRSKQEKTESKSLQPYCPPVHLRVSTEPEAYCHVPKSVESQSTTSLPSPMFQPG